MSFAEAEAAIEAKIATDWDGALPGGAGIVPIHWQNRGLVVPNPPFIQLRIMGEREAYKAFGGGFRRNELDVDGRVEIEVFVPLGSGASYGRQLRDKFAFMLRGQRFSGCTFYGVTPLGGGNNADQGNCYSFLSVADFVYRFKG